MCAWYNSSWSKRKAITLTGGASGAQTDYQVKLTVTWDSDMKSDFSDLRFTKADGTTLLDAWMESHTASTSAIIWIETDTPANTVDADIYMYYGNSGASSDWDIQATMLDGDDFPGAALDSAIWNKQYCDAAVSSGILTLDNFVATGGRYACGILGKILIGPASVTEVRINIVTSPARGGTYGLGTHHLYTSGDEVGIWHAAVNNEKGANSNNGSLSLTSAAEAFSYNTYYKYTMVHTGSTAHFYRDDVEKGGSPMATNLPDAAMYMKIGGDSLHSPTLKVDWIFSRKYAASPATYSVGSEETDTPAGATQLINGGLIS